MGRGGVFEKHLSEGVASRHCKTVDVTLNTDTSGGYFLDFTRDRPMVVLKADLVCVAGGTITSAGSLVVGIAGDTNAIVEATSIASGAYSDGDVTALTLADTLRKDSRSYQTRGNPVVPADTMVLATFTGNDAAGGGNPVFVVQLTYMSYDVSAR